MEYDTQIKVVSTLLAANVPVILMGDPGVGKTAVINDIAESNGWAIETVLASVREPSDFAGLPIVDPNGGGVRLESPSWAKSIIAAGGGMVFFDEINTAPPSVQAALLRVIAEKVVGDTALPFNTRMIAACNPEDIAADGWRLPPPLANRMAHIEWVVPAEVVANGFGFGFPKVTVPVLNEEKLDDAIVAAKGLIGAFLRFRADLVGMPKKRDNLSEFSGPFPSPRTWELAARGVAAAQVLGYGNDVQSPIMSALVGPGAALAYFAWVTNLDLPSPAEALANPEAFVAPKAAPQAWAFASSLAAYMRDGTKNDYAAATTILCKLGENGMKDIGVVAFTEIIRNATSRGVEKRKLAKLDPKAVEMYADLLTKMSLMDN